MFFKRLFGSLIRIAVFGSLLVLATKLGVAYYLVVSGYFIGIIHTEVYDYMNKRGW